MKIKYHRFVLVTDASGEHKWKIEYEIVDRGVIGRFLTPYDSKVEMTEAHIIGLIKVDIESIRSLVKILDDLVVLTDKEVDIDIVL